MKRLLEEFHTAKSREEIYQKVIEWGKKLKFFNPEWKIEENRVIGCQSLMYLKMEEKEGLLYFYADSDALISKGLAALLIEFYNGHTPEMILKSSPTFLAEMGILESLTPGRANGLASLHAKIRERALEALIASKR